MLQSVEFKRRPPLIRYAMATICVAVVFAIRVVIDPMASSEAPLMMFTLAVTGAAWFGGMGPGFFATLFSALIVNYRFMEPSFHFALLRSSQVVALCVFVLEGTAISLFLENLLRVGEAARRGEEANRLLERRILEVAEEEQRRIGQDLHDGIGQTLTGTSMMAHRLSLRLQAEKSPLASDASQISTLLNEAITSTRDIGKMLAPPLLATEGFSAAMTELCGSIEQLFNVSCTFDDASDRPIQNTAVATHLFRIVQEAISNAIKHAHATKVRVEMSSGERETLITVTNDGSPYVEPPVSNPGLGLRIMRFRAKMIGAALEIKNLSDGRTMLACALPEHSNDAHPAPTV